MKQKRIVYIGHAVADENGKATGGKKGDQTTSEVRIQEWYDRTSGWTHVFRFQDLSKRRKCAEASKQICNNDNIGYSQGEDRISIYEEGKKVGYDFSKIKNPCSCDCATKVGACVRACGVDVSKGMYTGNEESILRKTGQFFIFSDKSYTDSCEKLIEGDILRGQGHTAIVVEVKTVPLFDRELRYKSKMMNGEDVQVIQNKLIGLHLLNGEADGIFGRKTESALKLYQTLHGLVSDGIFGKNTCKAMGFYFEKK